MIHNMVDMVEESACDSNGVIDMDEGHEVVVELSSAGVTRLLTVANAKSSEKIDEAVAHHVRATAERVAKAQTAAIRNSK